MIGHDFWLGKLLTVFMADRADLGRPISGSIKSLIYLQSHWQALKQGGKSKY